MKSYQSFIASRISIIAVLSILAFTHPSIAEVSHYQTGPIEDHNWAPGAFEVANYPTRLRWTEDPPMGGGRFNIYYACTSTEEFNEVLQLFAAIQTNRLELVINSTTGIDTHWIFRVWDEERWAANMRSVEPTSPLFLPSTLRPVPPPRIEVYDAGDCKISWQDVVVPPEILVIDRRTGPVDLRSEVTRLKYELEALRAEVNQLRELLVLLLQEMGR